MKKPAGGGKSFMRWYQENLDSLRIDSNQVMKVLNAASYSRKIQYDTGKFVARFDGVWQLGGYDGLIAKLEVQVSRLKNQRLYECLEDCDKVVFQSLFSKSLAETLWGARISKPSTIICNPIRSEESWSNIWKPTGRRDGIKILSYHRHTPLKCSYLAPEVAKRLATEFDCEVELVIIGDSHPIAERYLREAIAHNTHPRTQIRRILGDIRTVASECLDSDFVLNLAHYDPCPNVVCESAGISIPQLLVRSGGIPEIVGDNYPYFIEPFAKYRSWLRKNTLEELDWLSFFDLVEKMRNSKDADIYCYARENHSPDRVFRKYLDFASYN